MTIKGGHELWKDVYDSHYDCVICPECQPLNYATTSRNGYREYKSDPLICSGCPTRFLCTHSKDCVKTVQRHIWKDDEVFADAKGKYYMRDTQLHGLAQVTNWVKLQFAAMNLKKTC